MDIQTAEKIIELNQQFYQTFSEDFSETRMRLQPGVQKVIQNLEPNTRILDLGCGNGQLARELAHQDYRGSYLGTDFSPKLLKRAQEDLPEDFPASFRLLDLASPNWSEHLPAVQFDYIFAFAALHHIPSRRLHTQILTNIHFRLKPNARFIHSNWQFLNSERLKKRIQPWEKVDIAKSEVDEGDYLLDWRRGGYGLRYVHHFSEEELAALAEETGFTILDSFYSDGKEGNLALYQVWTQETAHS